MADIFISYARKDRDVARRFAALLTEHGWTVWWDRQIRIGYTFSTVIERELAVARCVVVIWSADSINSEWVNAEAAEGAERKVLVPIRIDDVRPPLEFRRRQTATLDRDLSDQTEVMACIAAIRGVIGEPVLSNRDAAQTPPTGLPDDTLYVPPGRIRQLRQTRRRLIMIVTVVIGAISISVLAYLKIFHGRFIKGEATTTAATSTTATSATATSTASGVPLIFSTDTHSRLAAMVGDGTLVNDQVLELRGFELSDAQRTLCAINGTGGPCHVEAFVFGESTTDRTAYTCAKLDRATYQGRCVDGKLEGVAVVFAEGTAKLEAEAYLSYFSRGRLVYPAVTTRLNSQPVFFGVHERRRSYGCIFYGLWDQSKTRENCVRLRKVYGDDVFSQDTARALNNRSFNLEKYAENFRQYLLNPQ